MKLQLQILLQLYYNNYVAIVVILEESTCPWNWNHWKDKYSTKSNCIINKAKSQKLASVGPIDDNYTLSKVK